jgi:ABC-type multidrug transport system fused ATPase/permease subunit
VSGKRVWALIALAVALAFLEGIGVGMLNPVLQYIEFGAGAEAKGVFGRLLYDAVKALGLSVNLKTLLILAFIPVLLRQVVYLAYAWATARVQQGAAVRMRTEGFSALVNGDLAFVVGEGFGNLVSRSRPVW